MLNLIVMLTVVFSGLMAGLFFAFTVAVMPGLSKLPDSGFISTMQSINVSIQNPLFLLVFMSIVLLLPTSTIVYYRQSPTIHFWLFLAATVVYLVGVFAVTVVGNIPLNNALNTVNVKTGSTEILAGARAAFENKWNSLNTIRTVSAIVSFILLLVGLKTQTV